MPDFLVNSLPNFTTEDVLISELSLFLFKAKCTLLYRLNKIVLNLELRNGMTWKLSYEKKV